MWSHRTFAKRDRYQLSIERRRDERLQTIRVQLIRKLAEHIDGIDLSSYDVGDVFDLPRREAELLIREGWAVPFEQPSTVDVELVGTTHAAHSELRQGCTR